MEVRNHQAASHLMRPGARCQRGHARRTHARERHARWIDHDEIAHIVVPTSPLRFHGTDRVATVPSPKLGQHNDDIYSGWLGLSPSEIADL